MSGSEYSKTALFNAAALGAFAVGTALILGLTYSGTKDRIAESQRIAEEKALIEVIGDQAYDNNLLEDLVPLSNQQAQTLGLDTGTDHFARAVRNDNKIQGFIFPAVAPDGYSGDISLLIGINTQGALMGVRVVEHRETPGLGDKVDTKKSSWILDFAGLSLQSPSADNWAVKKDGGVFDAFTGATITPRAVVKMIKTTLELGEADIQLMIEQINSAQDQAADSPSVAR